MKVVLQQISEGSEEIRIRYRQMTEQIEGIVHYIEGQGDKLIGMKDGQQFMLRPYDVLYLESVEGTAYLYTEKEVYRSSLTLMAAERAYGDEGYFRCSKSMVLNIYRIRKLQSMSGNRIDVTMDNGEHVVISRRYAKELRNILKGEMR
ncbi:MAG: LytTR family transcriptional regulator DNA-binding domain-containing protein [Lachnospiraceae bacterium]|nr:LytTR family transcriptional regulator DNA-binding domain-containing protein [Lachnospiraceae bacterium]